MIDLSELIEWLHANSVGFEKFYKISVYDILGL